MQKNYIILTLLLLPFLGLAQTTIKGKVIDLATRQWLPGATVLVEGGSDGAVTDENGNYVLTMSAENKTQISLTASFNGYQTQTVVVKAGQANANFALTEESTQIKDVVVSANRRLQTVQEVPMSISTISPVELRRNNALEFRDYASRITNMSFGTQGGGGAFGDGRVSNQIVIRGVGGQSATSFYINETPLPETIDPRLIDVARVEVLRGPQGTLYGSGSMGGAVKVITNQPDATLVEGTVMMQGAVVKDGGFDNNIEGTVNLPIVKNKLALRVAGFRDYQSGVFDKKIVKRLSDITPLGSTNTQTIVNTNTPRQATELVKDVDNKTKFGFHATLGWNPIQNLSLSITSMYQSFSGTGYDLADSCACNRVQKRIVGMAEPFTDKWSHNNFTGKYNLGKGIGRIVVSTSYTDRVYDEVEDESEFVSSIPGFTGGVLSDNGTIWAATQQRGATFKKFVQEARFVSDFDGKFNFSAGVYYADETLNETGQSDKSSDNTPGISRNLQDYFINTVTGGAVTDSGDPFWYKFNNKSSTTEWALFGEAYYNITDKLKATVGLRYFNATRQRDYFAEGFILSTDKKNTFSTNQTLPENGLNPRFILNYEVSKDINIYGSASRGFRLGGLNDAIPPGFCTATGDLDSVGNVTNGGYKPPKTYGSDFVWSYELGFKSMLMDRKLMLNTSFFYNDWYNMQFSRILSGCGFRYTGNVGRAFSAGFDIDAKYRIMKGLDWGLGIGYNYTQVSSIEVEVGPAPGDGLLFTPRLTASTSLQYAFALTDKLAAFIRADVQYAGQRVSRFPEVAADDPSKTRITNPSRILAPYTFINSRFGVTYKKYEFALYATNLTDTSANFGDVTALGAELQGRPRYMTNRPMTVGLQARAFF
jgi:iron complex outermembrane recepter protein